MSVTTERVRVQGLAELSAGPDIEIVIPVYNEQAALSTSVRRLDEYLSQHFPFTYRIMIVDNASTDATFAIAMALADDIAHVRAMHLDQKGRGRALDTAWMLSDAKVLAYMDVDLSTDLAALMPLVAPLMSGHSDVAVGSRLSKSARVMRGPKRETISRCYNVLLRATLGARFSDAQCGFKAIRADRAHELLPEVKDREWFFDTELLIQAERAGLRIHEVPVDWIDDPDSRVDIGATVLADLRGIWRMIRTADPIVLESEPSSSPGLRQQLLRFIAVGILSTLAFGLLFIFARMFVPAQLANAIALCVTAVFNTALNRRFTFGVKGRRHVARHQLQGFAIFVLGLVLTSGSLLVLHAFFPGASSITELVVLTAANLVATLIRFVLMRSWVFRVRSSVQKKGQIQCQS